MPAPRPLAAARRLLSPALLAALLTGCEMGEQPGEGIRSALRVRLETGALPPPTEHFLDEEAEEENAGARRAWMESMHRAAPDVDWRVIERRNGEAQRAKRNALAKMAATTTRWTERGSENQSGNTMSAFPSPDGTHLYVGSALGGTWRSPPDGSAWQPLGDNTWGGAAWLAILPGALSTDPDVILRSTDGGLIDVSRDEGATWTPPAGLPGCDGMRRVLVTADGTHTVFLVAHANDGPLGTKRWGVYRSTDAAQNFVRLLNLGTYPGDLWATRTGPTVLYCARNGKVQVSLDKGDTWSDAGTMNPSSDAEITGSEAGAPRLWVVLQEGGSANLYRSDDAGASWSFVAALTDYWGALNASITNADLFAYGGVEMFKTTNGGTSFVKQNGWGDYYGDPAHKLHADMMGFDVYADGGGEAWFINTHGGTYRSTDGLATVANLSLVGLNVSQYYTTHTSTADPLHIVAGAQDQGYQWTDDPPGANGLIPFDQIISGDYGHATSGDGTHAYVYSVYPGFLLIHKGENNPQLITDDFPAGETYGWLPTVVADPDDPTSCFFCARHLWRYKKSPVGINNWLLTQYSTFDFAASGGEYLTALDFAPTQHQRAYAVTSAGRLFHSADHGLTWTLGTGGAPDEHYFYGNALVASQLDPLVAYVGGSGYSGPAVRRTQDGGATWSALSDGLPPTLVYSLVESPDGSLFAGTETTAYRLDPGATTWVDITSNQAPVTIWWSAEYVPSANAVRFGTYGRGIWDYSLDEPCAYEAYGVGLGGSNVITLDSASPTTLGTTHVLEVSGASASSPATLAYSTAAIAAPFKGGTLLVSPATWLLLSIVTDGAGSASIPLPVPADALLEGLPLNWQVLQNSGGWKLSNGLAGTLCP
jgi:photosystem II stability/assembly factor-like uncharacterized protein